MSSRQYTDAKAKHEKRLEFLEKNKLSIPSLQRMLKNMSEEQRKGIALRIRDVLGMPGPDLKEETIPSLDEAYKMLGQATVRLEKLRMVLREIDFYGSCFGYTIRRRPKELLSLETSMEMSVALITEMCLSILQKEKQAS